MIKPIVKKKFTAIAFDSKNETFVVYIIFFTSLNLGVSIYLSCKTQIRVFLAKKTFIVVFDKYAKFINIFFVKKAITLLKYTGVNDYIIILMRNQQPLYGPIYSLKLMELKILKMYIKVNQANNFINAF